MPFHLRVATATENAFYEEKLYPIQDAVLALLADSPELYMTGDTALARFYLQHRLSDDLDIFIKVNASDSLDIINYQKRADRYARDLAGKLATQFDITNEFYMDTFAKFTLQNNDIALKIDFVREYNHIGKLTPQNQSIALNNLLDIAVSKIAAFEDRCEIKDIIDLFWLTQQLPLNQLLELASQKRVPLAYERLLTINTQGVQGSALLLQDVPLPQLNQFIDTLRIATEAEIKKKENHLMGEISHLIMINLWDFPPELRNLNNYSVPILEHRLKTMALPERNTLNKALQAWYSH